MTKYTVKNYQDQAVEYSPDEEIPEPTDEREFESLAEALHYISNWLPVDRAVRHRLIGQNAIGFYETGEPWDTILIRGESIEDEPDDAADNSPEFGETDSKGVRAGVEVEVRRPLNEYTSFDEVFVFYKLEPTEDMANREGVPMVEYHITNESRRGKPGVRSSKVTTKLPPGQVPGEVIARAEQMCDFIDFNFTDG